MIRASLAFAQFIVAVASTLATLALVGTLAYILIATVALFVLVGMLVRAQIRIVMALDGEGPAFLILLESFVLAVLLAGVWPVLLIVASWFGYRHARGRRRDEHRHRGGDL